MQRRDEQLGWWPAVTASVKRLYARLGRGRTVGVCLVIEALEALGILEWPWRVCVRGSS
jgi:hypothetical protein